MCGTEGKLWITRSKFTYRRARRQARRSRSPPTSRPSIHVENFLDCVRSRKLPNGDVYIGHRSAMASHLGNIAYVQKRRLNFDPVREAILPL